MTSEPSAWTEGWWNGATRSASPNFDTRPVETNVKLVVLHHISLPAGQFEGDAVRDFFENRLDVVRYPMLGELADVHVSAHFFLRRAGEVLQFGSCDDRAWHAGVSAWRGRGGCNDFSIGIEIEGDAVAHRVGGDLLVEENLSAFGHVPDIEVAAVPDRGKPLAVGAEGE